MKAYAYISLAFSILGFIQWYSSNQYDSGLNACKAEYAVKLESAVSSAKETEKAHSASISEAIQGQFDELSTINTNLLNDLDELRKRPERDSLPDNPAIKCEAANGSELSGIHARFLVRFAASSAKQDAALVSCYAAYDSLLIVEN